MLLKNSKKPTGSSHASLRGLPNSGYKKPKQNANGVDKKKEEGKRTKRRSIYVGQLNDQVGEKKQIKKRKVKGDFGFRRKKGKKVSSLGCFLCLENETIFLHFFLGTSQVDKEKEGGSFWISFSLLWLVRLSSKERRLGLFAKKQS